MAETKTGADLRALLKEQALLEENMGLIGWDQLTGMPVDSGEFRAELQAYLTKLYVNAGTGDEAKALLAYFNDPEHLAELDEDEQALFERFAHDAHYLLKVPADDYIAFERLTSKAHDSWALARAKDDYALYQPDLEGLIKYIKQFIPLWRKNEATPYDVLLEQYEPGLTVAKLDAVFEQVKTGLAKLQAEIKEHGTEPNNEILHRSVTKAMQREYTVGAIERLGYNFNKGRLDDTIHPFMQDMNRNDARITTRWADTNFPMAVLGLFHEAGHGLFAQNVDPKWDYTPFNKGISMSMHESQSLFNEIIIGRDEAFWQHEYPTLQATFGDALKDVSFEEFYPAWMKTQPTLIRTEADPLTYPLHIIIRYEIEKAIFNDDLDVADLPALWNAKYVEYLGIEPTSDLLGVLQDVHWAGGAFGYFPSYALGHLYAAQFRNAMNREMDVEQLLGAGEYQPLIDWRKEHVWRFGASKTPGQVLLDATGEELNPQYWLDLQAERYRKAYKI
ncbi:MAG: carboxypeptidase M32 [Lactobacillaceae bacterium]|nr:carboxypeptidase M32 [Lactobacillaceae bacterium]